MFTTSPTPTEKEQKSTYFSNSPTNHKIQFLITTPDTPSDPSNYVNTFTEIYQSKPFTRGNAEFKVTSQALD